MRMISGAITSRSAIERSRVVACSTPHLAVEDLLVGPQQVEGGHDDPDGGHHGPPPVGEEGPGQHQELAHEPVQPGQADGGQHGHGEGGRHDRGRRLQPAQLGDLPGLPALVDPADEQEQGGRHQPVVHHQQHAAGEALGGEGEGPQGDEADLGQRRVGHQPLHVPLGAGHHGPVEDADHGQGEQHGGQVERGLGEQVEVEADDAVGAQLGQDRGQDHRAAGRGLARRRRGTRCGTGTAAPSRRRRR